MCDDQDQTYCQTLGSSKSAYQRAYQLRSITADCSSQQPLSTGDTEAASRLHAQKVGNGSHSETPPRWEKVLWKKQPYPDNYTDASFLQQLVRLPPDRLQL